MSPELKEVLFQALGEASMCWSEYTKGVFKSERCKEIGEEVISAFDRAAEESGRCANPSTNTPKVDITTGKYSTVCCGIKIGSYWEYCPRCGKGLW